MAEETAALTNVSDGTRILCDTNGAFAINAWDTAVPNGEARLHVDCPRDNPDCMWLLRDGMIVSARDTRLALKPQNLDASGVPVDHSPMILSDTCSPEDPNCKWIWTKGMLINAGSNLALNAWGGPQNGGSLVLNSACSETSSDCSWTLESVPIISKADPRLSLGIPDGASQGSPVKLLSNCSGPSCTWTFRKGTIVSDLNQGYGINAWNAPASTEGAELRLHNACVSTNGFIPWCNWTLKDGMIYSDYGYPGLAVTASGPLDASLSNPLKLGAASTSQNIGECYLGNPSCLFKLAPTPAVWSGATAPVADWTIMVMEFGDEPTIGSSWEKLVALESMGHSASTDKVNVVVLLDTPQYDHVGTHNNIFPLYRSHGVYLRINQQADPTVLADLGEIDMGDPNVIGTFGKFVASKFPATHNAIIIRSHGASWYGVLGDEAGTASFNIPNGAYDNALSQITGNEGLGKKLDIVAFDSCAMGEWEVAAATAPYADYLVASEQNEYGSPWRYKPIISQLVNASAALAPLSAQALGISMVDNYDDGKAAQYEVDAVGKKLNNTLSLVDLSDTFFGNSGEGLVTAAISKLATDLKSPALYDCVETARGGAVLFDYMAPTSITVDLFSLVERIATSCSANSTVVADALAVQNALVTGANHAVLRNNPGNGVSGFARGLTIFLPAKCGSVPSNYYAGPGDAWSDHSEWDEFLRGFAPPGEEYNLSAPPIVKVTANTGDTQMTLNWTMTPNYGMLYTVQRSTSPTGVFSDIATNISGTSYIDSVSAGTAYYYKVIASRCSQSVTSAVASATLETEALTVAAVSGTHVQVSNVTGYHYKNGMNLQSAVATNRYVTYTSSAMTVQEAGTYKVVVQFKKGSNAGKFQVSVADSLTGTYTNIGAVQDSYSASNSWVAVNLGNLSLNAGQKYFKFTVTGKNYSSSSYQLFPDYLKLTKQ